MDDIGIAAFTPAELIENLQLVFKQLHKEGLKLSMIKNEFRQQKIEYLGRTTLHVGIAPIEKRVINYLQKLKLSNSVKNPTLPRVHKIYRSYIGRLIKKTTTLQILIKKTTPRLNLNKATLTRFLK